MLGLCFLPKGKVGLVVLLAYTVKLTTGIFHVLQRASAKNAVLILFVICLDIEIDTSVRLIGKAVVEDLLHQLLLFDDMAGSMGLDRGTQTAQRVHGRMIAVGVVLCNLHRLKLFQPCLLGYLVLTLVGIVLQVAYVGDVAHVTYLIAQVLQVAEHKVERDGWTGVSQMWVAINRRSADVHAYIGGMKWFEALLLTRQRVINNEF